MRLFSSLLELLCRNKETSRLIQLACAAGGATSAAIPPSAAHFLIRNLIPFFDSLAFDSVGAFVLTAAYEGSTVREAKNHDSSL